VATTYIEDGQKQITTTSTALQTKRTKEHRKTEEEMGGSNFTWRIKEQATRLTPLFEHEEEEVEDMQRCLTK
jgi:hypothetical protein